MIEFRGWPGDATVFLAEIAADNTREFWTEQRQRHAVAVHAPMRALAAELEPEFGPVRVFRPFVNRRFRPDAPPYRTDTGGVATSASGCALAVVLSATGLAVSAGHWSFDRAQLRRYRVAVAGVPGERLAGLLGTLDGHRVDAARSLTGLPRGYRADHPRIALLRRCGLQVTRSWPAGEWLATREPLERVRACWRAMQPVVAWLDAHVGAPDPVQPRPRPDPEAERPRAGSSTGS